MTVIEESLPESRPFEADVAKLLSLMVHSVYANKDVFLRELISNGADACEKLRYEAIANPALLVGAERLEIRLKPEATAKTLTIADTGIGMDRQELLDNLGTVARSGTKAFLKGLKDAKDGLGLIDPLKALQMADPRTAATTPTPAPTLRQR